ncbi:MAG: Coenzyme F420 hydrogenase/dehydrogenase, beta subunit C-terminal domain [Rhodanobacteraceae bacterium]|nr:Coenzyme F420 hydrogenase/dehydrogenase, beta subunit C-terminal domain [Rhodanobacteraceae bacterium]
MTPDNQIDGIRAVIDGGYCIGCGACTAVIPEAKIAFNRFGDLQAILPTATSPGDLAAGSAVCPFTSGSNETEIALRHFKDSSIRRDAEVGSFLGLYAAFSKNNRSDGSSGGLATWLLTELLNQGAIDYAINVRPSFDRSDGRAFSYQVTASPDQIRAGSTSFYYPVSMDEVLAIIRARPGRYAVTGVPCFHKALRRLRCHDSLIDERIKYQIGLVCGQLKSAHYLEYLTALAGGDGQIQSACFRRKIPDAKADEYAFEATVRHANGTMHTVQVPNSRIGINWGMGYFKPLACDFCDDVLAETADIAVMDAWLPGYVSDSKGWSLVVSRTRDMEGLLQFGGESGALTLEAVAPDVVADSQRGGLNHRRTALPYRLQMKGREWHPTKRALASDKFPILLRIEQRLRAYLRSHSRTAWHDSRQFGGIKEFQRRMKLGEFFYRLLSKLKRTLQAR